VAAGGAITGEHGVGIEKLDAMCEQFDREEIAAFIAVKRAFDPALQLNPGKAIPTLDRCAQYGKRKTGAGPFRFLKEAR
jgi:glycolate oxidase